MPLTSTPVQGPIGTVHTVNIAGPGEPAQLRYFGKAHSGVTGQAHPTRAQAEADVLAWHQGKPVAYVKHAEMPAGYTDRLLAAWAFRRLSWWGRLKARWRARHTAPHSKYHTAAAPGLPYLAKP